MPVPTIIPSQIKTGPGIIYYAPLGSTPPTSVVTGSVFTDAWPAAWLEVGATDEGFQEDHEISTDDVEVAESLYPIRTVTTGKTGSASFAMAHITPANYKLAMNGGTLTVTGATTTTLTDYIPPLIGAEVRSMIGWQGEDNKERLVIFQAFQSGSISIARRKGAEKAVIGVEFRYELPDPLVSSVPFKRSWAGA